MDVLLVGSLEKRGNFAIPMEVFMRVEREQQVALATEQVIRELKERLWDEVWRDEIDLPGMRVTVEREKDGRYLVKASIDGFPV